MRRENRISEPWGSDDQNKKDVRQNLISLEESVWAMLSAEMNAAFSAETCDRNPLCPLSRIRVGTAVRIKQLRASDEMSQRLREIGFCEEQIIRPVVIQASVICQVCNARLAISAKLAEIIFVEPVLQAA